jgi:hypothetical protein
LVEVALRWRTYAFVKQSCCGFLDSHLNKLDVFIVAVDVLLAVVINLFMARLEALSEDASKNEQYASFVSGLRVLRLFRLFRVARAVRVLRKLVQEVQGTAEGFASYGELDELGHPDKEADKVKPTE